MKNLFVFQGTSIRLTDERAAHILDHPEMRGMEAEMVRTLGEPEIVVESRSDSTVLLYYRYCAATSIGAKYLCVVVKTARHDAFILTAYLTDRAKRGKRLWPKES